MSKRRRRRQLANRGPDGLPQPLKWRPRVRIFGLISGALGGLGTVVLIQQYGIAPLGRALTLQGLIGGALSGVIIPSVIFAFVVRKYNRRLAGAMRRPGPGPAAAGGLGMAVLFTILVGTFGAAGTAPAAAEINGTCDLVVNGVDVRGLRVSASDAIVVESEESLTGFLRSPSDFASFELRFFYAGFSYGFGDSEVVDDPDGGGGTYTFELPVDELFQYAGGLYEVRGGGLLANGQDCTFGLLFNVDHNPLETLVGRVAAGVTAVGVIGLLGVSVSTAVEGGRMLGDLSSMLVDLDHDGIADAVALDVNADGIVDAVGVDTTGDGFADQFAVDSDSDGTFDRVIERQDLGEAPAEPTTGEAAPSAEPPAEPTGEPPTEQMPSAEQPGDLPPGEPTGEASPVEPTGEVPPVEAPAEPTGGEAAPSAEPPGEAVEPTGEEIPPGEPTSELPPVEPTAEAPPVEPTAEPTGGEAAPSAEPPGEAVEPTGEEIPPGEAPAEPTSGEAPPSAEPPGEAVEPTAEVPPVEPTAEPTGGEAAPTAEAPPVEPTGDEIPPGEAPAEPTAEAPPVEPPPVEPTVEPTGGEAAPTGEAPPAEPTGEASPVEPSGEVPPVERATGEIPSGEVTPVEPTGGDVAPTDESPIEPSGETPPVQPPVVEPEPGLPPPAPPEMPGSPPPAPPGGPDAVPPDAGTPPPSPPIETRSDGILPELAGGAVLGPAAIGALAKAVQRRSSGTRPDDGPYWFSVDQPTTMYGLEEYKEVGQLAPGSWYLARGTYGEWIHAVDQQSAVEGWIATRAARPAPSS